MSIPKGWGLEARADAKFHWSARAIYQNRVVDLLWDRQSLEGHATAEESAMLQLWLDTKALPVLRARAERLELPASDDRGEVTIEGDGYQLRANPNGSCGYLYLSAAPAPEATGPTPKARTKWKVRR